jgi:hypothetical protein
VIAVFGVRRGSASAHRHAMEPNAGDADGNGLVVAGPTRPDRLL